MLLESEMVSSLFKLIGLSVGVFVNVIQYVVVKSIFCCNTKLMEGAVQEKARLVFDAMRFNCGAGVVCEV